MWREYFSLIDAAPKEGTGAKTGVDNGAGEEKDPGKSIPKVCRISYLPALYSTDRLLQDDDAKARLRAEQETRDAKAAFAECSSFVLLAPACVLTRCDTDGSVKFLETYWRFMAMDDPDQNMLRFLRARKWSTSAGVAMVSCPSALPRPSALLFC